MLVEGRYSLIHEGIHWQYPFASEQTEGFMIQFSISINPSEHEIK